MSQRQRGEICHRGSAVKYVTDAAWWNMSQRQRGEICRRGSVVKYVTEAAWWNMSQRQRGAICRRGSVVQHETGSLNLIHKLTNITNSLKKTFQGW